MGRLIHNLKMGDNISIKVNGVPMLGKVTQCDNGLYYIVYGSDLRIVILHKVLLTNIKRIKLHI